MAERVEELDPSVLRKYAYWTRALDALHAAYGGVCAYACFYIEPLSGPTVDHFVAIARSDLANAYEWDNYRLACSLMNARKVDSPDVLDPCEVEDGWCELDLNTLTVKPADSLDVAFSRRVDDTIRRLGLNSKECMRMRRRYFDAYWSPKDPQRPIPLGSIERDAPFLVREIRRLRRVREEGDAPPAAR